MGEFRPGKALWGRAPRSVGALASEREEGWGRQKGWRWRELKVQESLRRRLGTTPWGVAPAAMENRRMGSRRPWRGVLGEAIGCAKRQISHFPRALSRKRSGSVEVSILSATGGIPYIAECRLHSYD